MKKKTLAVPVPPSILDNNWRYIPSSKTNVAETFARLGFIPPSTIKDRKNAQ
jgi:hypothetical protein